MDRRALAAVRAEAFPILLSAEDETFREVEAARAAWKKEPPSRESVRALSEAAAERALRAVDAAVAAVSRTIPAP